MNLKICTNFVLDLDVDLGLDLDKSMGGKSQHNHLLSNCHQNEEWKNRTVHVKIIIRERNALPTNVAHSHRYDFVVQIKLFANRNLPHAHPHPHFHPSNKRTGLGTGPHKMRENCGITACKWKRDSNLWDAWLSFCCYSYYYPLAITTAHTSEWIWNSVR